MKHLQKRHERHIWRIPALYKCSIIIIIITMNAAPDDLLKIFYCNCKIGRITPRAVAVDTMAWPIHRFVDPANLRVVRI